MVVSYQLTFWPFPRSKILDLTFCFTTLCNNLRVLIFSNLRNHSVIIVNNYNNNNNHALYFVAPSV